MSIFSRKQLTTFQHLVEAQKQITLGEQEQTVLGEQICAGSNSLAAKLQDPLVAPRINRIYLTEVYKHLHEAGKGIKNATPAEQKVFVKLTQKLIDNQFFVPETQGFYVVDASGTSDMMPSCLTTPNDFPFEGAKTDRRKAPYCLQSLLLDAGDLSQALQPKDPNNAIAAMKIYEYARDSIQHECVKDASSIRDGISLKMGLLAYNELGNPDRALEVGGPLTEKLFLSSESHFNKLVDFLGDSHRQVMDLLEKKVKLKGKESITQSDIRHIKYIAEQLKQTTEPGVLVNFALHCSSFLDSETVLSAVSKDELSENLSGYIQHLSTHYSSVEELQEASKNLTLLFQSGLLDEEPYVDSLTHLFKAVHQELSHNPDDKELKYLTFILQNKLLDHIDTFQRLKGNKSTKLLILGAVYHRNLVLHLQGARDLVHFVKKLDPDSILNFAKDTLIARKFLPMDHSLQVVVLETLLTKSFAEIFAEDKYFEQILANSNLKAKLLAKVLNNSDEFIRFATSDDKVIAKILKDKELLNFTLSNLSKEELFAFADRVKDIASKIDTDQAIDGFSREDLQKGIQQFARVILKQIQENQPQATPAWGVLSYLFRPSSPEPSEYKTQISLQTSLLELVCESRDTFDKEFLVKVFFPLIDNLERTQNIDELDRVLELARTQLLNTLSNGYDVFIENTEYNQEQDEVLLKLTNILLHDLPDNSTLHLTKALLAKKVETLTTQKLDDDIITDLYLAFENAQDTKLTENNPKKRCLLLLVSEVEQRLKDGLEEDHLNEILGDFEYNGTSLSELSAPLEDPCEDFGITLNEHTHELVTPTETNKDRKFVEVLLAGRLSPFSLDTAY